MLRAHLKDAAIAAAKAWSHAAAEPRHVGYAIARHFKARPDVADLLPRATAALEPRGTAFDVPALTEEAAAIVASIGSPDEAVEALRQILGDEASASEMDTGPADVSVSTESAVEAASVTGEPSAPTEEVGTVLAELDALVGLSTVKEQVRQVIAVVQANQAREQAGLAAVNPGLHLVFTGPPGTGKTTVARLMARLYAASGALPGATFTEVDRSDLVGGYVGQTALKTSNVVKRTIPGVLFVDEAYSLTPTHASDFGGEAIATLVKSMEDHRSELAVIVAGYGLQMAGFLESNPGLRSRLKTFIDFPDYDPGELTQIFTGFANSSGLSLAGEAVEKAEELFERAVSRTDFGNARFARSLFEQAYARMALRAAADGEMEMAELTELTPADLEWNEPGVDVKERRIGFGESASGGDDTPES